MNRIPTLFRAVVPVTDIGRAIGYYRQLLQTDTEQVGPGRCYLHCEGAILVCVDAQAEGHGDTSSRPNGGHLYFAVDDLDAAHERALKAGGEWLEDAPAERAWGERSFYARDPFGNPLCLVERRTVYTGSHEQSKRSGS
jgi:predicted enzyme related to lactoylglutathione lyase